MKNSLKWKIIAGIILTCGILLSSCSKKNDAQKNQITNDDGNYTVLEVKKLGNQQSLSFEDHSFLDWDKKFLILSIPKVIEWKSIHGRKPQKINDNSDAKIDIYMARDNSYWYIGVDVNDDVVLESKTKKMYSGDSLEIFFAGNKTDSKLNIFELVSHPEIDKSDNGRQSYFFQLEIPPIASKNIIDHFPDYRTDKRFIDSLKKYDCLISIWKYEKNPGYAAKIKLPFGLLSQTVLDNINNMQPVKIGIDFLDYDMETANEEKDNGFWPDNVFALLEDERAMNVPFYMQKIIFEK